MILININNNKKKRINNNYNDGKDKKFKKIIMLIIMIMIKFTASRRYLASAERNRGKYACSLHIDQNNSS